MVRGALFGIGSVLMSASPRGPPGAGKPGPAQAEFFEAKVRPVLAAAAIECHGPKKQKGGLRLDSPEAMRTGGDSGPAVVAGRPGASPLIEAIRHDGDVKMPPKGKLDAAEIAALTEWVKRGAAWPARRPRHARRRAAGKADHRRGPGVLGVPAGRRTSRRPAVKDAAWPKIADRPFILAQLEAKGLQPSPPADKRTLIRRATFDLIGLPPTPEEVEAFVARRVARRLRPGRRPPAGLAPLRRALGPALARRGPLRRGPGPLLPAPALPQRLPLPRLGRRRLQRRHALRPLHRRADRRRPARRARPDRTACRPWASSRWGRSTTATPRSSTRSTTASTR